MNIYRNGKNLSADTYIVISNPNMEMIFGTLELILGDFVQIKKFELDGDPLYFYGF